MKSKTIPQYEFPWNDEAFTLVIEQTIDGDRLEKESKNSLKLKQESEMLQEQLI